MPKKFNCTYNAKQRRWFKEFRKKQYTVKCTVLEEQYPNLFQSATKEGSYRAANQWWQEKLAEIDRHPQADELERGIAIKEKLLKWANLNHNEKFAELIKLDISAMRKALRAGTPLEYRDTSRIYKYRAVSYPGSGWFLGGVPLDPTQQPVDYLGTTRNFWHQAYADVKQHERWNDEQPTTKAKTFSDYIEPFIADLTCSDRRKIQLRGRTTEFCDWLGPQPINANTLAGYKLRLLEREDIGGTTKKDILKGVKQFIRWLYHLELIEDLPRNYNTCHIARDEHHVSHWTDEEVAAFLSESSGQVRLWGLLALNCGFYSSDIGTLTADNIDWLKGAIKVSRHKTNKGGDLWFPLWKETFSLLKKYGNREGLVFTNKKGLPLWREKYDSIGKQFARWKKTSGCQCGTMKDLRKTARNKLEGSTEHESQARYFLQHSTSGVDDSFYRAALQERFTAAVEYIGECFGL